MIKKCDKSFDNVNIPLSDEPFVQHISFDNNAELIVSNDNNVYIIVADPVHGTNSLLTRNFILMRIDKESKSIAEVELIQSNVFCLKSSTS